MKCNSIKFSILVYNELPNEKDEKQKWRKKEITEKSKYDREKGKRTFGDKIV